MNSVYLSDTGKYHDVRQIIGSSDGRKVRVSSGDLSRGSIYFGGNTYALPRGLSFESGNAIYAFFSEAPSIEKLDDNGDPVILPPSMQLNGIMEFVGAAVIDRLSSSAKYPSFGTGANSQLIFQT